MSDPTDQLRTEPNRQPRLLAGKYRLGRLLGQGGMGAVYEADHEGLGTKVAVKLLHSTFAAHLEAIVRFRREARAAAAVRHENIVAVTDIDSDNDVHFIVMELLEGETLEAFFGRERQLDPKIACGIIDRVLTGLSAAHDAKVVHRDLKPGNVFLTRNADGKGRVKILDFGISKFVEDGLNEMTTNSGLLLGTLPFMAPEQLGGDAPADVRIDVYAVGVILYLLVLGLLPYKGRSVEEIKLAIQTGPKPPRQVRPELPEALEAVILRAIAKAPDDRFPDSRTFREELRRAIPEAAAEFDLAAPPTDEHPISSPRRTRRVSVPPQAGDSSTPVSQRPTVRRPGPPFWTLGVSMLVISVLGGLLAFKWLVHPAHVPGPAGGGTPAATANDLHFGVTRYLPRDEVTQLYEPLAQYLSANVGRPVRLVVKDDYVDFATELARGNLQLGALSPYAYVRAKRKAPGLRLLATPVTEGGSSYQGVILARADAGVLSLQDLRNKVFCYVNPTSSSGYLYPRALLKRAGIDPDKGFSATRFTGDHLAALHALQSGACDGAAVFSSILFDAKAHGISPEAFRIVASTERIPYDAYCASDALAPDLVAAVQAALLKLAPGTPEAAEIFRSRGPLIGFAKADDADYDSVRKIEQYLDTTPKR